VLLRSCRKVSTYLVACALLTTGCGSNSGVPGSSFPEAGLAEDSSLPELRSVPKIAGVELLPQDPATLPVGKSGADYNAIPPCELVKWSTAEEIAGMAFETEESYNAEHEFRHCGSTGDLNETMIVTTRVDRLPLHQLYDGLQKLLEEQGSYRPYDGHLPGYVAACMWMEVFDSATINGMACRTAGNAPVHFLFQNGADPEKLVEMMEYGLAVADLYYDEYYDGHI